MSTENQKSEYLFLFRGTQWQKGLSPEQLQAVFNQFGQWFEKLTQEGKLKTGQPLEHEGRLLSGPRGRIMADGPFAESKEAIGGYFIVWADSLDAAVEIARDCPALEYGGSLEVRPVAADCPTARLAKQQELATAGVQA